MTNQNLSDSTNLSGLSTQAWRENFLQIVLIGATVFGTVALIATFLSTASLAYESVFGSIYTITIVYAVLLLITIIRLPYTLRTGIFLGLLYVLGLSSLLGSGPWGDARIFLLAFVFASGLFYSAQAGMNSLVLGLVPVAVIGFLTVNGLYQPSSQGIAAGTLGDWLAGSATFVLLGALIVTGLRLFQTEFARGLEKAREAFRAVQTERRSLETHVAERTRELEGRNSQMRASVYFTREIADIQAIPTLLSKAVALISQHFGHFHAALFLLDDQGKTAVMQAASSEAGRKMVEDGYRVKVDDRSLIGRVAERGKLYVSLIPDNATAQKDFTLPQSRSEIALPLIVRGKIIGVLDIQSEQSQAFGQNEAEILQLLADQIAASIDNVRLLNESQAFVNQLETLTSQQTRSAWNEFLKNRKLAYQFTPAGIKSITTSTKPKDGLKIPLILRGQEIGSIALKRKDTSDWGEAERDLAEKVAIQVALALDNSRLLDETRQQAVHEQTVNEISARFSRSLDMDTLLQTAVRELAALPDVAEASVYIKPPEEDGRNK